MNQDFRLGLWVVQPSLNSITLNGTITRLEPKAMEVLVCLAEHAGNVVSKEQLIGKVWTDLFVSDDVLTRCVSDLRRAFDDNPRTPRMIETIPKRGYRLMKRIEPLEVPSPHWVQDVATRFRNALIEQAPRKSWMIVATLGALILALGAVRSLPWIARIYNNRGAQLQQRGKIQEAIQDYLRALSLRSDYAEAHYNLADAYEEIPNYEKAQEEYQRAIDADLTFYPAYNNLSRLYILRRRDYDAALRLLERAMSLKPEETSVQYSLYKNYGWANLELHNLGQAEENLRFAVGLNPDRGAAHCLLAKVLDAQGNATVALGEWESCAAYSTGPEVEPEWRNEAQERLRGEKVR